MPLILGDRVLDEGLKVLDLECNAIYICHTQPTTYNQATATYALGTRSIGVGNVFGAPEDDGSGGRKIVSVALNSGSNLGAGTPSAWAAVDTVNSRFLASGPLVGGVPYSVGGFDLTAITIGQVFDIPLNIGAPSINGAAVADLNLTIDTGQWAGGEPITYSLQWYEVLLAADDTPITDDDGVHMGAPIDGATAPYHKVDGIPVTAESTWNEYDRPHHYKGYLSEDRRTAFGVTNLSVRGTRANSSGRRYFELRWDQAPQDSSLVIGLADATHPLFAAVEPGLYNDKGVIFTAVPFGGGTQGTAQSGTITLWNEDSVFTFVDGTMIGIACDLTTRTFWASINGVWWGTGPAYDLITQDPGSNQGGIFWGTGLYLK